MSKNMKLYHYDAHINDMINFARSIKTMCVEIDCVDCPFYNEDYEPECLLAPKDDNNIPATWEV